MRRLRYQMENALVAKASLYRETERKVARFGRCIYSRQALLSTRFSVRAASHLMPPNRRCTRPSKARRQQVPVMRCSLG